MKVFFLCYSIYRSTRHCSAITSRRSVFTISERLEIAGVISVPSLQPWRGGQIHGCRTDGRKLCHIMHDERLWDFRQSEVHRRSCGNLSQVCYCGRWTADCKYCAVYSEGTG